MAPSYDLRRAAPFRFPSSAAAVAIAFAITLVASPANGQVYRWVDETGRVHYSDRPQSESAEQIATPKSPPPTKALEQNRAIKRQRLLDAFAKEREEQAAAKAKQEDEQKERKVRCARAKDRLQRYQDAQYIYDLDENGNEVVFSFEERARFETEARENVRKWCGSGER